MLKTSTIEKLLKNNRITVEEAAELLSDWKEVLTLLCKQYPNDQELGEVIRQELGQSHLKKAPM